MIQPDRENYARKALSQIPRLLSLQDRNPFSPTYGCFNREYWLNKTLDFPSSIAQFGVHSLALSYAHPFPHNPYYQQKKILDYTFAGIDYWTKIQKNDGSFDEFYPNERGWAGPTAFLLYAVLDSYRRLKPLFPKDLAERMLKTAHRSALFLAGHDEPSVLANHHAIALLAIYEGYLLTEDPKLLRGIETRIRDFLKYCVDEGWSLEYGGADPGYLSATVSFLGKLHKIYQDDRLLKVVRKSIEFSSYFVYPNGFYAGTAGSRQTLHFYPDGYEIFAKEIPLAAAVADKMLLALGEGKLVPPEIQGDRYFLYRIPEFLLSYLDYQPREHPLPLLPYEKPPFETYFKKAQIYIKKNPSYYLVVNLMKGGVIKLFNSDEKKLVFNDCGILAQLENGKVVTTQWLDPNYKIERTKNSLSVSGRFRYIKFNHFTPWTMIIFRIVMLLVGWHTKMAYHMKGWIRKVLVWKSTHAPVRFERKMTLEEHKVKFEDTIEILNNQKIRRLMIGDEFNHRYVPQSMYFQSQELAISGYTLTSEMLNKLNHQKRIVIKQKIDIEKESATLFHQSRPQTSYQLNNPHP